jgi:cobalt-zinc-cadmium efflux system protein
MTKPPHNHSHDHQHDHGHIHTDEVAHNHKGHGHSHAPSTFGKAFLIGIALNVAFVLIEGGFGVVGKSMALLADAGHNLSDVLGLVVAWTAVILSQKKASNRFTYGLGSSSILAALFNAVFLLVAVGGIIWEALLRLNNPQPVEGSVVMAVAGVGILVNGITAWLFAKGRKGDINIRGAYLHMMADAGVSLGVVIAGLLIMVSGWNWLDPIISLAIAGLIIWTTWGLLKASLRMSLGAVPEEVKIDEVKTYLSNLPGVASLHDLHIWPLSTTQTALTCHLVVPKGHPGDAFLLEICTELKEHFAIQHATLQIETKTTTQNCPLETCTAPALPM